MSIDHFFKGSSSSPTTPIHIVRWHPSSPGFVKLNLMDPLLIHQ